MTTTLKKPQKSVRKAKGDGHLRRAEILAAAERIFVAEGYDGATIRKIADEVGVSSTALYMHFADKDAILLEISDQAIQRLLTANSEISVRPVDAVTRVRMMLEVYMDFALTNPNTYLLVFCAPSTGRISAERQAATQALGDQCFEKFASVVHEIAADGRLRTGTAASAAQTLWAGCHGLVSLIIVKDTFHWSSTDELQSVMLDGLLYGLVTD